MANIFDRFDAQPQPAGGNVFDQFDGGAHPPGMPQEQPDERSLLQSGWRGVGLAARTGLEGVGNVLDTLAAPLRVPMGITGETGKAVADTMGLPTDETRGERAAMAGGRAVAGAMVPLVGASGKVAQGLTGAARGIAEAFASNPTLQMLLSGLSGVAGQTAKEEGAGAGGEFAASVGAPIAAAVAGRTVAPIVRRSGEMLSAMTNAGALKAAGRVATDTAKDRASAVATAIRNGADPETAAQAAVPARSSEFAGLERIVRDRLPSEFGAEGTVPKNAFGWLQEQRNTLNQAAGPIRTQILAQADATGLNVAPLSMEVARLRTTPGFKDETATNVLGWLDKEITRRADEMTGEIAGVDLYGLRKDLGKHIQSLSKDPNRQWDKKTAASLLARFQKSIDWEIEKAAGSGDWTTEYMKPFADRMQELEAVKGHVKSAEKMGMAGAEEARRISNADEIPITLPNLLSRPMMVLNAVLRKTQGYGGEKTRNTLADLMLPQNKGKLATLMEQELGRRKLRMPAMEALRQGMRAGAYEEVTQ